MKGRILPVSLLGLQVNHLVASPNTFLLWMLNLVQSFGVFQSHCVEVDRLLWFTIFLLQDVCGWITQHEDEFVGDYLSTKIYISTSSAHFFVQRSQVVQWQYLDLELLPNAMIRHNIPSLMSTRLIYVYQGELSVSGTVIPSSTVASLEGDDIFEARAGNLECFNSRFVTKVQTNIKM